MKFTKKKDKKNASEKKANDIKKWILCWFVLMGKNFKGTKERL